MMIKALSLAFNTFLFLFIVFAIVFMVACFVVAMRELKGRRNDNKH